MKANYFSILDKDHKGTINELMAKYEELREEDNPERYEYLEKALDLGLNLSYKEIDGNPKAMDDVRADIYDSKNAKLMYKRNRNYNINPDEYDNDMEHWLNKSIENEEWSEQELENEVELLLNEFVDAFPEYSDNIIDFVVNNSEALNVDMSNYREHIAEINSEVVDSEPAWLFEIDEDGRSWLTNFSDEYYTPLVMKKSNFEVVVNDGGFNVIPLENKEKGVDGFFIGRAYKNDFWEGIYLDKTTRMYERIVQDDLLYGIESIEEFAVVVSEGMREEWREYHGDFTKEHPVPTSETELEVKEKQEIEQIEATLARYEQEKLKTKNENILEDNGSTTEYYKEKDFYGIKFNKDTNELINCNTSIVHSVKPDDRWIRGDFVIDSSTMKIIDFSGNSFNMCVEKKGDTIGYFAGNWDENNMIYGFFTNEKGVVEIPEWDACELSEIKKFCINAYETGKNTNFREADIELKDYKMRKITGKDFWKDKYMTSFHLPDNPKKNKIYFNKESARYIFMKEAENLQSNPHRDYDGIIFDSSDMGIIHKPDDVICYTLKDEGIPLGAFFGRKNKENDLIEGLYVAKNKCFVSDKTLNKNLFSMEDIKEFCKEANEKILKERHQDLVFNKLNNQGVSLEEINKELFGTEPAYVVTPGKYSDTKYTLEDLTNQKIPDCVVRKKDLKVLRNINNESNDKIMSFFQEKLYSEKQNYVIYEEEELRKAEPDEKILLFRMERSGPKFISKNVKDLRYIYGINYVTVRESDLDVLEKEKGWITERVVDEHGNAKLLVASSKNDENLRTCFFFDNECGYMNEIGKFWIESDEKMKDIFEQGETMSYGSKQYYSWKMDFERRREKEIKISPNEEIITLNHKNGIGWYGDYRKFCDTPDSKKDWHLREYAKIRKSDLEILGRDSGVVVEKIVDENGNTNLFMAGLKDFYGGRPCFYYESKNDFIINVGHFRITSEEKVKEIVKIAQERCREKTERDREEDLEL